MGLYAPKEMGGISNILIPDECKFLKHDLEALDRIILAVEERLQNHGKLIGSSCREAAETFHDNFPFEQALRDWGTAKGSHSELKNIRNHAQLVEIDQDTNMVNIGHLVSVIIEPGGFDDQIRIGSYRSYSGLYHNDDVASYASPLAQALLGHKVGEICEYKIDDVTKKAKIIKIEL